MPRQRHVLEHAIQEHEIESESLHLLLQIRHVDTSHEAHPGGETVLFQPAFADLHSFRLDVEGKHLGTTFRERHRRRPGAATEVEDRLALQGATVEFDLRDGLGGEFHQPASGTTQIRRQIERSIRPGSLLLGEFGDELFELLRVLKAPHHARPESSVVAHDAGRQPWPRTTRPGLAPVCSPPARTWTPLTKTWRIPVAYWCGFSKVA